MPMGDRKPVGSEVRSGVNHVTLTLLENEGVTITSSEVPHPQPALHLPGRGLAIVMMKYPLGGGGEERCAS